MHTRTHTHTHTHTLTHIQTQAQRQRKAMDEERTEEHRLLRMKTIELNKK